jgi:hypothetical protein
MRTFDFAPPLPFNRRLRQNVLVGRTFRIPQPYGLRAAAVVINEAQTPKFIHEETRA